MSLCKILRKQRVDYLSNTDPWTFPDGFDVEVFSYNLLKKAFLNSKKTKKTKYSGVLIEYLRKK